MADNVTITEGSGTEIATDEVNSAHYQIIKIASGGDGVATLVSSTDPLPVALTSTTVTGTVAVTQSGTWDEVGINDSGNSITVDNGGTFAIQENGAALTSLQLIDDTVFTDDTSTHATGATKGLGIMAVATPTDASVDANDIGMVAMTTSRLLKVDASGVAVPITDNSGSLTVDNTGTFAVQAASNTAPVSTMNSASANSGLNAAMAAVFDDSGPTSITENSFGFVRMSANRNMYVTIRDAAGSERGLNIDASGQLAITVASIPSHAVTNAGTFVVQENGAALTSLQLIDDIIYTDDTSTHATGTSKGALMMAAAAPTDTSVNANDIGAVAMTTDRKLHVSVQDAIATVTTVSTVTTLSTLTGGAVAHDGVDSGNPIKIGARAASTLSDDTMVANADRTDAVSDLDGALLIRQQFPLGDLISEQVTNTNGTSTAFTNFGAVASTRSYVTAITVYNSSVTAGTVDFRDGTAGTVLWTMPIPAGGGSVIASAIPLFRTTANTALAFDVSGALTTVTISVSGFKSKV